MNRRTGLTLIELVITVTVLAVMTLAVVPFLRTSIKRHRETQLRAALAEMRAAIDDFRRDALVMPCPGEPGTFDGVERQPPFIDPRNRVVISDCSIISADNPDRYPPTLETLAEGVNVVPRAGDRSLQGRKKIYLRSIPIDPMTGHSDWQLRSSYDPPHEASWGGENVFDVRSRSTGIALNGEKYKDW